MCITTQTHTHAHTPHTHILFSFHICHQTVPPIPDRSLFYRSFSDCSLYITFLYFVGLLRTCSICSVCACDGVTRVNLSSTFEQTLFTVCVCVCFHGVTTPCFLLQIELHHHSFPYFSQHLNAIQIIFLGRGGHSLTTVKFSARFCFIDLSHRWNFAAWLKDF